MDEQKDIVEVETIPSTEPAPISASANTANGAEASLGQRIGAFLIDFIIVLVISAILGKMSSTLGLIVTIAYWITRDCLPFLDGQSLGKKALKIKAVTESGQSLSGNWSPGLIRNVVLIIPFFALVELIVLIIAQGKPGGLRRLGDQWAKTKVITIAS